MNIDIIEVLLVTQADRLRAFASVVFTTSFGQFAIRDLKVIEGRCGLFLAMPSRKVTAKCDSCHLKNEMMARFCNWCGGVLIPPVEGDRLKMHADVFHPLDQSARRSLESEVFAAYRRKLAEA